MPGVGAPGAPRGPHCSPRRRSRHHPAPPPPPLPLPQWGRWAPVWGPLLPPLHGTAPPHPDKTRSKWEPHFREFLFSVKPQVHGRPPWPAGRTLPAGRPAQKFGAQGWPGDSWAPAALRGHRGARPRPALPGSPLGDRPGRLTPRQRPAPARGAHAPRAPGAHAPAAGRPEPTAITQPPPTPEPGPAVPARPTPAGPGRWGARGRGQAAWPVTRARRT